MTEVLATLILAHLVSSAASASSVGAAKSALLPVRADVITLDDAPSLTRLDAALRRGNASLLDADATIANVSAAKDAGVVCGGNDQTCLSKLAALLDVDRVLSPHATRTTAGWHVAVVVVDRAAHRGSVDGDVTEFGKDARALVDRALTISLSAPTAPSATAPARPTVAMTSGDDDAPHAPTIAGAILAGAGAALVAGGAITTTAMEIALQKPELFADRETKLFAGQAGVLAVVVGALAAGGGAVVVALDH